MARITTTPISGAPMPYNPKDFYGSWKFTDKMKWQMELEKEEALLKRLTAKMSSRTSANVKAHLTHRIQNCEARIAALKLAYA